MGHIGSNHGRDEGPHDAMHRTGRDSMQSIHIKSYPLNKMLKDWEKQEGCDLRGYARCDDQKCHFVRVYKGEPDHEQYPNLAISRGQIANKKLGPAHFPQPEQNKITDDICSGKICCVSQKHYDGPENWGVGPTKIAKSLHSLCNVRFKRLWKGEKCQGKDEFDKEMVSCGSVYIPWGWSKDKQLKCNCIELPKDRVSDPDSNDFMKFQGFGLDSTDILPGGKHFSKGWDVYQLHSWAMNKAYEESGICGKFGMLTGDIRSSQRCRKNECRNSFIEDCRHCIRP
eukprot:Nk52_evm12s2273 gene=Nk52_evmTU12s2273